MHVVPRAIDRHDGSEVSFPRVDVLDTGDRQEVFTTLLDVCVTVIVHIM